MQVAPRPVLTNVALQVPVLAVDASSALLEADLLKGNLQLAHTRLQLADLVSPSLHTDRETLATPLEHKGPHCSGARLYICIQLCMCTCQPAQHILGLRDSNFIQSASCCPRHMLNDGVLALYIERGAACI